MTHTNEYMSKSVRKKAYLGSPSGFSESTIYWYGKVYKPLISKYVDIIDPWTGDYDYISKLPIEKRQAPWTKVGLGHLKSIESCDLFIGIFDGEPPDNGTVVEAAWAAAHSIPVVAYRNDFRTSGEEGMPYNLMLSAVIDRSNGVAVGSLAELETELRSRTKN